MSPTAPVNWNEEHQSEGPATALLEKLGYEYVRCEALEVERGSLKEVVLTDRLARSLKKLNPWLSDDNLHQGRPRRHERPRRQSHRGEREALHDADLRHLARTGPGDGQEEPHGPVLRLRRTRTGTNFSSRASSSVHGTKKHIRTDLAAVRQRHPARHHRVQEPDARREVEATEAIDQFSALPGGWMTEYRELGAPKLFETVQLLVVDVRAGRVVRHRLDAAPVLRGVEGTVPA